MGGGGTKDKVVGSVKEKAGGLVGNDRMKVEGKAQHARGDMKATARSMSDKAADAAERGARRASDAVHRRT